MITIPVTIVVVIVYSLWFSHSQLLQLVKAKPDEVAKQSAGNAVEKRSNDAVFPPV